MMAERKVTALDTVVREDSDGSRQYELRTRLRSQSGFFGETFKCVEKETGTEYCLRVVPLTAVERRSGAYNEEKFITWGNLRHANVLRFIDSWRDSSNLYIRTESAKWCLEELLRSRGRPPPQSLFEKWLYQIASALKYLHHDRSRPVVHRNLKPASIVVTELYSLRLTDFGVCRELEGADAVSQSIVGTAAIMSPEMLSKTPYTAKTDIWSFGITAVYIATLQRAIEAKTFHSLFKKAAAGEVVRSLGKYSTDVNHIVRSMLQADPQTRPTSEALHRDIVRTFPRCKRPPERDSYPDGESRLTPAVVTPSHNRCSSTSTGVTDQYVTPRTSRHDVAGSSGLLTAGARRESDPRLAEVNVTSLSLLVLTTAAGADDDREDCREDEEDEEDEEGENNNLLYTFPGAYRIQKNDHTSPKPSVAPRTRSRSVSEAWGPSGAQTQPHPINSLLPESVSDWPPSLQEYWDVARSLLTKMSLHHLLDALMIMELVGEDDLKAWLMLNFGDGAENCVEDLRRLSDLDRELNGSAITSVMETFRQRPASSQRQ